MNTFILLTILTCWIEKTPKHSIQQPFNSYSTCAISYKYYYLRPQLIQAMVPMFYQTEEEYNIEYCQLIFPNGKTYDVKESCISVLGQIK